MKLKTLLLSTVLTATATAVGFINSSPAQALSISAGSRLELGGAGQFNAPALQLDFLPALAVTGGTGSFTQSFGLSLATTPFPSISDIPITGANTFNGSLPNFIQGVDIGTFGPPLDSDPVAFELTEFIYNATDGNGTFKGIFSTSTDSIAATGIFTSDFEFGGLQPYKMNITAVPTPALLPGLIGMGVAALRKRKGEEEVAEQAS